MALSKQAVSGREDDEKGVINVDTLSGHQEINRSGLRA